MHQHRKHHSVYEILALISITVVLVVISMLIGSTPNDHPSTTEAPGEPSTVTDEYVSKKNNRVESVHYPNNYTVSGPAVREYNPASGEIAYCPLDDQRRPACAYGLLTTQTRAQARERGRQDIDVNPIGWPEHNTKAQIGSYHGWFWNRSHLLADSLGGDPVIENLITGTRTQNVGGSADHTGGMAYTEDLARDYLDDTAHASCPLYYAVTPPSTPTTTSPSPGRSSSTLSPATRRSPSASSSTTAPRAGSSTTARARSPRLADRADQQTNRKREKEVPMITRLRKKLRRHTIAVTVPSQAAAVLTSDIDGFEVEEYYQYLDDTIEELALKIHHAIATACRVTPRCFNGTIHTECIVVTCTVPVHVGAEDLHRALDRVLDQYNLRFI